MLKVVVLISGGGSNLKALLDAAAEPTYPAKVVAVGSDTDAAGLEYARAAGIDTFMVRPRDFENRDAWGEAFAAEIRTFAPDLVVSAGLMRVLPGGFVREFSPRLINTHPALLPLISILGLLLLTITMHLARGIGYLHGQLAKHLLVHSPGAD